MEQHTLAMAADEEAAFANYRKPTRCDEFLKTMASIAPYAALCALWHTDEVVARHTLRCPIASLQPQRYRWGDHAIYCDAGGVPITLYTRSESACSSVWAFIPKWSENASTQRFPRLGAMLRNFRPQCFRLLHHQMTNG